MRTVYLDSESKFHAGDSGNMVAMETSFFDGMCDKFIEGYLYDTSKGYAQIYPWKQYSELDAAQREYERQKLKEYETLIDELYSEVTE